MGKRRVFRSSRKVDFSKTRSSAEASTTGQANNKTLAIPVHQQDLPRKDDCKRKSWLAIIISGLKLLYSLAKSPYPAPEKVSDTFENLKGIDETIRQLRKVVEVLRNQKQIAAFGVKMPKGVLLVGKKGAGKTLLARAVAGEAKAPFFSLNGLELQEISLDLAVVRIRNVFEAAKANAPCVIFIKNVDSFGYKAQLLAGMDGIGESEGTLVIATTNPSRIDNLEDDFFHPGRFSIKVPVGPPDLAGRKQIVQGFLAMRKINCSTDVDVESLARETLGFTGGHLEDMLNEAALRAAIEREDSLRKKHLTFVREKIFASCNAPQRKFEVRSEDSKLRTAYHEAGHAVVMLFTEDSAQLHKVTLISHDDMLGVCYSIWTRESKTRSEYLARMDAQMGGMAGEDLMFGHDQVGGGSYVDLHHATTTAAFLVKSFGASDRLGLRSYNKNLRASSGVLDIAPGTQKLIDAEIKRLVLASYKRAKKTLSMHLKEHKAVAEALLKHETLYAEQIKSIIAQCNPTNT